MRVKLECLSTDILQFALSIDALRGGIEVARGRVPISDLSGWLLLDGASRGVLALAGGNAGAWVGLIVIGPAGALVLGPAIGGAALLGNGALKSAAQKRLMAEWLGGLLCAAGQLHVSLVVALERRIKLLDERSRDFTERARRSDLDASMARQAQDDLVAALEDRISLDSSHPNSENVAIRLLFTARNLAPSDAEALRGARL